ncbi:hypothetical protein, partial [Rhodoferax sp.]|uniref:hypothetical protein n=1 Tax=Rhodoferax sp. TaxID=50421 RepID=UPI0025CD9AA2
MNKEAVTASHPYPARYRTRTLNRDFVTASVARQSMQSGVMDCVTSFAMTGLFMESVGKRAGQKGTLPFSRAKGAKGDATLFWFPVPGLAP